MKNETNAVTAHNRVTGMVARFLIACKGHIADSWMDAFIECGAITLDTSYPTKFIAPVVLPDDVRDDRQLVPTNHERDAATGAWHQVRLFSGALKVYDAEYVRSRYDAYKTNKAMSMLRWDVLYEYCIYNHADGRGRGTILDFGCGNGAFCREGMEHQWDVRGYDISGYPVEGVRMIAAEGANIGDGQQPIPTEIVETKWRVVTFFDSLEHVPEPDKVLGAIDAQYIVISVPWCHGPTLGKEWFAGWKHYRPDEHLWYWDAASLCRLLAKHGYRPVFIGNPEDAVRTPVEALPNILTGVFKRV